MPKRARHRKRPNGEGSIYARPDGGFLAVVSLGTRDGRRIRKVKRAATREEARAKLKEMQSETLRGATSKIKVEQLLRVWLKTEVKPRAENTYNSYRDECEKRLIPELGYLLVVDLGPMHINGLVSKLAEGGTGARTISAAYAVLNTAMKFAMRMGIIAVNPCTAVPRPKRKPKDIRPFDRKQAEMIIRATKKYRLAALYVLALTTGMRQGELFGLRKTDLDLEAAELTIAQQAIEVRGKLVIRPPKTKASRRTISLTPQTVAALRRHFKVTLKEGNAGSSYVFCTEGGDVVRRSNFGRREWAVLLKQLELDHRGFHHCRHTVATMMLAAGSPVHIVSRMLGHSRPSITLDIYAKWMPADNKAAADAMARLLG